MQRMLQAAMHFHESWLFGKGNASLPLGLVEQMKLERAV